MSNEIGYLIKVFKQMLKEPSGSSWPYSIKQKKKDELKGDF